MGCATSKQKERLCRKCHAPCSPPMPRRSYSVHTHTSLDYKTDQQRISPVDDDVADKEEEVEKFSIEMIKAKTWSKMIDEKIRNKIVPRTPVWTPPGEPETIINAWELMEGLEDVSPLRPRANNHYICSFSFHVGPDVVISDETRISFSQPMWLQKDDDHEAGSNKIEFDADIISSFREAMDIDKIENCSENINGNCSGIEKRSRNDKVILYFTSLRGVRKTYEDCCHVRAILKSIGVRIDERDVSMHSGFKEELKELLGDEFSTSPLPRVFLGEEYIGGAEEIGLMHEEGKLEGMLLDSCEVAAEGGGRSDGGGVCEACGDIRFVPCERCSGSCKIYYEDDYDDDDGSGDGDCEGDCGFKKCPDCNENGLVRCPICCD